MILEESFGKSTDFISDGMNAFERNVKRIGDCLLAFIALVVFSPLFLICYIAVRREDGGPAIFRQERIGRFGRPFNIYKFRSMRLDAEKFGPCPLQGRCGSPYDPCGQVPARASFGRACPNYGMSSSVICLLSAPVRNASSTSTRSWNAIPAIAYLYQIRPGVTSYATLYNGYTDTLEKMLRRLRYDLFYLEHRSWWFDFKILVKTFLNIAFGKKF